MAQTIQIKRSPNAGGTAAPSTLSAGELAYSDNSGKLFIGRPNDGAVLTIGGESYVNMLDHTAGTLTASSAIIVDANSKIDKLLSGNIQINNTANQIDTTTGDLVLNPASNLDINAGTIDISAQATELSVIDNSATAFTISEGSTTFFTIDTTNSAEKIKFGEQVEFSGAYTLPTGDGSTGQALVTNGSGVVTFEDVAATLTVDGDSTTADVALLTDDLQIHGGEGINTSVSKVGTDITLTIEAEDASDSNKGVASFDSTHFTASSGAITANDITLASDSGNAAATIGETFTFTGGEGIDTTATGTTVTIAAELATSSNKGVASFDSTDFTVSSGDVTVNAATLGSTALNPGETATSLAGLQQLDVDNVRVDTNTISTTDTNGDLILSPNGTGTVTVPSGYKNRTGFGANSLVSKEYVDAIKQALDVKDSVRLATTATLSANYNNTGGTLTNSGSNAALQLDGITVVAGNRILVKDQSSAAENGIYVVTTVGDGSTAWVLTRAEDADVSAEMTGGVFTFVEEGTVGADNGYVFTHNGAPTLGTTALTVSQFSGAGQIVAGEALTKSGNTLNVNDDNITLEIASDALRIKGITTTALGDLLIGAATDGGYTRLTKPSSNDAIITMGTAGTASWTTILDGGTF